MNERFTVICVPVPAGGYCVRDNRARPIPLIAFGQRFATRHQPHSRYYDTAEEAMAVACWLADRAARYPVNLVLCDPLMADKVHYCMGCGRMLMGDGGRTRLDCPAPMQPCVA